MSNTIIQLPKTTEEYCLDMPNSLAFHKHLSATNVNYTEWVDQAKGLLSEYFTKQGIQTGVLTTIYEDTHMAPNDVLHITNADFSFKCTAKDIEKLRQNINNVFAPITPAEIRATTDWSGLPIQKYPILGKF